VLVFAAIVPNVLAQSPPEPNLGLALQGDIATENDTLGFTALVHLEAVDVTAGEVTLLGTASGRLIHGGGAEAEFVAQQLTMVVLRAGPDEACVELYVELAGLYDLLQARPIESEVTLVLPIEEREHQATLSSLLCRLARVFDEGSPDSVNELVPAVNDLLR
jgi:hypothetical protein